MQITGDYFEFNKSQRHEVLLLITPDNRVNIKSRAKRLHQHVAVGDIDVSPRLANTPRVITFPDGASFETLDNDAIDQWLKDHKSHNSLGWIHQLESRLLYVLLTLMFVVLFSWGFIQYGVPAIADSTAKILPKEINQYLGKGSLALLDKSYFTPSELSASRQMELRSKFNVYTDHYEHLNINVIFRHGGNIGANAFALPDGHIVFTDEMVALAKDDLELMAIFGHEIGHLERRHLLRRVIQDSMLASLVVLISGDITYASSVVIAMPVLLLELAYSRQFEEEADQFALQFLIKNTIPKEHFARIMLRLSKQHKTTNPKSNIDKPTGFTVTEYLSTHPVTQERIQPFLVP